MGMGGIIVSDYAGLIGPLAQKIAQGISDLWYKEIPQAVYDTPSLSARMTVVKSNLASLEKRFREYLQPYLPNKSWNPFTWLKSFGTSITLAVAGGNAPAIHSQLKLFEKELSGIGTEWASITGYKKPPSTEETNVEAEGGIVDFGWSLLKLGAVGLGIWWLYNYLDKQSMYPKDQLPRYAGGRRRSGR